MVSTHCEEQQHFDGETFFSEYEIKFNVLGNVLVFDLNHHINVKIVPIV